MVGVAHRRALAVMLAMVGMVSLAALACTSDQEWIIPRTATPTPTNTPRAVTTSSEFAIGDTVVIVGTGFSVWQTYEPEPDTGRNRVIGTQCFPGSTVEILDIGQDDAGNLFYKVHCVLDGWISAANVQRPSQ